MIQPLHDRVLVRRIDAPLSSPVIVPDAARAKPLKGVVIAVGPGRKHCDGVFRETMVKPGDEILFSASVDIPYADLLHQGDLVMMAEADILGILHNSRRAGVTSSPSEEKSQASQKLRARAINQISSM